METYLKFVFTAALFMAAYVVVPAQNTKWTYHDEILVGAKGHIKKIHKTVERISGPVIQYENDENVTGEYKFHEDGSIITNNGFRVDFHNENGYPTVYWRYYGDTVKVRIEQLVEFNNTYIMQSSYGCVYEKSWFDNLILPNKGIFNDFSPEKFSTKQLGLTHHYEYDAQGNMVSERYDYADNHSLLDNFEDAEQTKLYKYIHFDEWGNWTKRKVSYYEQQKFVAEWYEYRHIEYWNHQRTPSIYKEPDKKLTVKDMISKPLGVVDVIPDRQKGIWTLKNTDIISEINKRGNWEMRSGSYLGYTVFGNHYEGKRKPIGYNHTYRGEPFFSAAAYDRYSDHHITKYDYSWHRIISGVVPGMERYRKNEYLNQPQWTKTEVLDFANRIIYDLEALGIRMSKAPNMNGDICTFVGEDNFTQYKVRVFRCKDRYSAFYSVSLILKEKEE